jgi:tetratricopeptide (TPR) repeat protein
MRPLIAAATLLIAVNAYCKGTPFTDPLPKEVRDHLIRQFHPFDEERYFKGRPAELVDLNGDGNPELAVDASCNNHGQCWTALYEKRGAAWAVIGEQLCEKHGWSFAPGKSGKWMAFVCSDGSKTEFDEKRHAYDTIDLAAKPAAETARDFEAGLALYQLGKFAEAAKKLDTAAFNAEQAGQLLYWRGLAHLKAGHREEGLKHLNSASMKNYLPAKLALGDFWWGNGSRDGAVFQYQKYVDGKGEDPEGLARARRRIAGEEPLPAKK